MRWTFVPLILCLTCCDDDSTAVVDSASTDVATELRSETGPDPDGVTATTDDTNTVEDTNTIEDDTTSRVSIGEPCLNPGTQSDRYVSATDHDPEYYVEQANKYFDTLDPNAEPGSMPYYSEQVVRWEWPPAIAHGPWEAGMIDTAEVLKVGDPSTVPERDCRFSKHNRSRDVTSSLNTRVVLPYLRRVCLQRCGEMTFIEAWSDLPGLRPQQGDDDRFGERGTFYRLPRVPASAHLKGA